MRHTAWFGMLLGAMMVIGALIRPDLAAAQESYLVQSGDTLQIEILEDPALNRSARVLPDGSFSFPFAGTLRAAGLTVPQIQTNLRNAIASNFAAPPNVFVAVLPQPQSFDTADSDVDSEETPTIDIFLLGEINSPGQVEMEVGATLLQAIAVAGGPSRFAATKRIQLRRTDSATGKQTVTKINYKALSEGAALPRDIELKDGDVILIPERRLFE